MDQQELLHTILLESLKEQRRRRRWGIFFKFIFLMLFALMAYFIFYTGNNSGSRNQPHTALIDLNGTIMAEGDIDADRIIFSLQRAFEDKGTKGIILRINSPGGSAVQASYIYTAINKFKKEHSGIKVYAVCTDVCASGAYFIAAAADQIYANPASLVGSIGVIMEGFGFSEVLKKLGIARRVFTAGEHKAFLDPFSPLKPTEANQVHRLLDDVHQQFIQAVKQGRGLRLKEDPDLFSGLIWTGNQAKALGLIDDFGSTDFVANQIIKESKMIDYTIRPSYIDRFANRMGVGAETYWAKQLSLMNAIKID